MKKIILAMLCLSALVLASCQKDDNEPLPTTAQQLLGAWKLDRVIEEDYHPINTLVNVDEHIGVTGDSIVFRADGLIYTYSDLDGQDEVDYQIIDEKTINIDDDIYDIKKLTDKEVYLYREETQQALDKRYVEKIYLKR